ncbi:MAG TPA: helix-turn-helix transcriptional regulator, partial [Gemmatimonadales bacterium]
PLKRLSRRQLEVMRLIAIGNTTRAIATRLKLSVKTVEAHRAAVLKRLELGTIAELARYAVWAGLISAQLFRDA